MPPAASTNPAVDNNLDTYRELVHRLQKVKRRAQVTRVTIVGLLAILAITVYVVRW